MLTVPVLAPLVLTSLLVTGSALAQQRPVSPYLGVGSITTIKDLNTAGTEYLNGGLFVNGGVNWQPASLPGLTFQGDLMWNKQQLHTLKLGTGTNVDLYFFSANIDYAFLTSARFAVSISGGGGGVVERAADTTGATATSPFARLGFAARYQLSHRAQLFAQTFGLIYDIRNFPSTSVLGPFNHRRQSAVGIGVGVIIGL